MATKYEVITKDQLRNILYNMGQMHVNIPYEAGQCFSPSQMNIISTIVGSIQSNVLNNIMMAISTLDHNETVTIDRCFLCDKNDTGGPKCPV